MAEYLTFTFGTTPVEIIRERLEAEGKPYHMELVGEDAEALRAMVAQGIDSHLEAIFGTMEERPRRLPSGAVIAVPVCCDLEPNSMLVLLRRLAESDNDNAWNLRSCILETLDIEEV